MKRLSIGSKTVWDPCPQGWKVPSVACFDGLSADDERFAALGYLSSVSWPDLYLYWTSTPAGNNNAYSFNNDVSGPILSDYRYLAAPVRCVKE